MFGTRHFLVVLLVLLGLGYTIAQCPPAILIRPCTCDPFFYIVQCSNITEMEVLVDVFERSGDRKFGTFALFNSSLMYLPASAIRTKQFVNIFLSNVTMIALFDDLPHEGNHIRMIVLQNVIFQRGVVWELFGPMKKLEHFQVENTKITSLGESFTDNISRDITNLLLNNSKTNEIQYNAFAQLKKLFELEIINSGIKTLQRSMFATPSALEDINFSGNKIESLEDDLFTNMPVLKKVVFNDNQLTTVAQSVFGSVFDRSVYIHLTGNPLACDCKILWFVVKNKPTISGRCATPADQQGKYIQDLKKKDLDYCKKIAPLYSI